MTLAIRSFFYCQDHFSLYFNKNWAYHICVDWKGSRMKNASSKAELIKLILNLKDPAINKGFDWPSQEPEEATEEELDNFYNEVVLFLSQTI